MIIELRETISSNKLSEIKVQSAKSPYNQIYNPDRLHYLFNNIFNKKCTNNVNDEKF